MTISELLRSLSAADIQLVAEDRNLKVRAPKGALTQATVAQLKLHKADLLDFLRATDVDADRIRPVSGERPKVLSFSQQRLWLLDQIDGGSSHYTIACALDLVGIFDARAFERAFETIVQRHEALRTCFEVDDDGEPSAVVSTAKTFGMSNVDLTDYHESERDWKLANLMATNAKAPFDLSCDVMLRIGLVKLKDEHHVALVAMHHIASDAWSLDILVNELGRLYNSYAQGQLADLPALPVQYADYAYWQRHSLVGEMLERELDYWFAQLAGAPSLHGIPLDQTRPSQRAFEGAIVESRIGAEPAQCLRELCRRIETTLFVGIYTAFAILQAHLANTRDVVIGTPVANRERPEVAGLIGFFVNTVVLRSNLTGEPNFEQLLQRSRRTVVEAFHHQHAPFADVVARLRPERSVAHSPLFQTMVVLQNEEARAPQLDGLSVRVIDASPNVAKYDLTLSVLDTGSDLLCFWEYDVGLFERATIEQIASDFETLVTRVVGAPDRSVFSREMSDSGRQPIAESQLDYGSL